MTVRWAGRLLSAFLVALTAIGVRPADACPCPYVVPTCQAYWESRAVFVGTLRGIAAIDGMPSERRLTFDVEQAERGVTTPTVDVRASVPFNQNECPFIFEVGQRYVVYAYGEDDKRLFIGACSRTRRLGDAQEDLAYFREMKGPSAGGRIFGAIRHEEPGFVVFGPRILAPIAGHPVRLQGTAIERELSTAKDGSFAFGGLTPGEYTLHVKAPEGMLLEPRLSGVYGVTQPGAFTVTLREARGCMPISFAVRERGGIRGVLVDAGGAPVEGELVFVTVPASAGTSEHVPNEQVRTGRGGHFEFTPLPRGQYVIAARLDARAADHEVDRRAYHSGTRNPREAKIITVDGPTIVDAGTFRLPPDPVERTMTGAVSWSDGAPAPEAVVLLHGATGERVPVDAEGRFRFTVPYGAYFTLSAKGERVVSGRKRESTSATTIIDRYDRDREVQLVLRVPE